MLTLRQRTKTALQELGLLAVIHRVKSVSISHEIKQIRAALPWYFYNGWLNRFPIHFVRVAYLRKALGLKLGDFCFIHMGARFNGNIEIGDHTVIGRNCVFIGEISIGNNVSITAETYIFTTSHILDSPTFSCFDKKVVLEDHSWVGARAMIQPGVTMGKGSVLGSNSTATKSIPAYTVFAGTPAKEIGKRKEGMNYDLQYSPYFE